MKKGCNNKKKIIKIFLIASMLTFMVSGAIICTIICKYNSIVISTAGISNNKQDLSAQEMLIEKDKEKIGELNKTVAVFGIDKEGIHTDIILVANLNTLTNKINILSIPRDTKVEWSNRQRDKYNEITGNDKRISKINEMYNHGRVYQNPANIRDFTIDEIENILGVKVDNFVIINIKAFREIVDEIGGVEVDVPRRMYYKDECQGLYIDLQPGLQTLNGDKSEQFVRFRKTLEVGGEGKGYAQGDIGRIGAQQIFLEAFAKKVISPQVIDDLPTIVNSLFKYVKTDIQITQVMEYLDFIDRVKLENIQFYTMPGKEERDIHDGKWYFYTDYNKLDSIRKDMFSPETIEDENLFLEE